MAILTDQDKQRIREAVEIAENQSSGEFVTVIARQADQYLYIPTLWAAVLSLLSPAVMVLLNNHLEFQEIYSLQLGVFLLLTLLFRWQALTILMVPKAVRMHRAKRLAWEQFFALGLHHTRERNGVMLFVSVAEKYVEIIADKGINDKVEQADWDGIIRDFTAAVKSGKIADGFVGSIQACGLLLETHFPKRDDDVNELSNHLVELGL